MQITKINSYNTNLYCQNNYQKRNSDVQFGQNPVYKLLTNTQKKAHEDFIVDIINYIPSISAEKIAQYINHKNKDQVDFLHNIARKLYYDCYNKKTQMPENAQEIVENLAFSVEKPDRLHYKILRNGEFSFDDSKDLILLANENGQNYSLIRKLLKIETLDGKTTNLPAKQIKEIVTSPNAKKLNEQYANYSSFIRLTREKPDFSSRLLSELELEKPSFDPLELDKIIEIQRSQFKSTHLQNLSEQVIRKHYSPKALELFTGNIMPRSNPQNSAHLLTQTDEQFATYILKTTSEDNFDLRNAYLKKAFWLEETPERTTVFFNKIDTDENFKEIYARLLKEEHPIVSTTKGTEILMYYVDSIGSDIALKKYTNFSNILASNNHKITSKPEEVANELSQNINNRFYISQRELTVKRVRERDIRFEHRTFPKLRSNIARAKRKFTYEFLPQVLGTGKPTPIKMSLTFNEYRTQKLKEGLEILEQA